MTAMTRHRRQTLLRHASGYIELGELLLEADKPTPASAQKLLLRALEELNQLPEPTRSKADAKLLEGEALRALGRWSDALEPLEQSAAAEPKRIEPWLGLGWCLKRLGRMVEAIEALERGLAASPQQPILYYNLACYWSLAGNTSKAIEYVTQAISIDGRFRTLTDVEPDFDPIRSDPRFVAITTVVA